jgi:hypothetical protein
MMMTSSSRELASGTTTTQKHQATEEGTTAVGSVFDPHPGPSYNRCLHLRADSAGANDPVSGRINFTLSGLSDRFDLIDNEHADSDPAEFRLLPSRH